MSQIAFLILSMVNREEIQFVNTQGCVKMTLHLRDESWNFFSSDKISSPVNKNTYVAHALRSIRSRELSLISIFVLFAK